jgi:hypothetical protein
MPVNALLVFVKGREKEIYDRVWSDKSKIEESTFSQPSKHGVL